MPPAKTVRQRPAKAKTGSELDTTFAAQQHHDELEERKRKRARIKVRQGNLRKVRRKGACGGDA
jgi:hypothetical protein